MKFILTALLTGAASPRPKKSRMLVRTVARPADPAPMAPERTLSKTPPVRLLRTAVGWAPVWLPLVLIWQLTEGGLKPAQDEHRRLEGEETAVVQRNDRTQREYERLTAQQEAWKDPLFRERVLREKARAESEASGDAPMPPIRTRARRRSMAR